MATAGEANAVPDAELAGEGFISRLQFAAPGDKTPDPPITGRVDGPQEDVEPLEVVGRVQPPAKNTTNASAGMPTPPNGATVDAGMELGHVDAVRNLDDALPPRSDKRVAESVRPPRWSCATTPIRRKSADGPRRRGLVGHKERSSDALGAEIVVVGEDHGMRRSRLVPPPGRRRR